MRASLILLLAALLAFFVAAIAADFLIAPARWVAVGLLLVTAALIAYRVDGRTV